MISTANVRLGSRRIAASVAYAVSSPGRALTTTGVALATFALLVATTYPTFSAQMFAAGPAYWGQTFRTLLLVLVRGSSTAGLVLVGLYAALTGVLVVVVAGRLRVSGASGALGLSGAVPGLLVSGCASCGAGLLGLLGATGAVALLPFHGTGVRAFGVAILVVLLARNGDPRQCRLPASAP